MHSVADASVALGRIGSFLTAEELAEPYKIDAGSPHAINVDGDFQWETASKAAAAGGKFQTGKKGGADKPAAKPKPETPKGRKRGLFGKRKGKGKGEVLPTQAEKDKVVVKEEETPFALKNLHLEIPKGAFVAIVGRVGSGKVHTLFIFALGKRTG